jgi:cytochrome c oxidase subunit 1
MKKALVFLFTGAAICWLFTGLFFKTWLGSSTADVQIQDTLFVIDGLHFGLGFAFLFGFAACIYYWWPRVTGRKMQNALGWIHFWLSLLGSIFVLKWGAYILMPRHYLGIGDWDHFAAWEHIHEKLPWVLLAMAAAQGVFIFNLAYSAVWGEKLRNLRKFKPKNN